MASNKKRDELFNEYMSSSGGWESAEPMEERDDLFAEYMKKKTPSLSKTKSRPKELTSWFENHERERERRLREEALKKYYEARTAYRDAKRGAGIASWRTGENADSQIAKDINAHRSSAQQQDVAMRKATTYGEFRDKSDAYARRAEAAQKLVDEMQKDLGYVSPDDYKAAIRMRDAAVADQKNYLTMNRGGGESRADLIANMTDEEKMRQFAVNEGLMNQMQESLKRTEFSKAGTPSAGAYKSATDTQNRIEALRQENNLIARQLEYNRYKGTWRQEKLDEYAKLMAEYEAASTSGGNIAADTRLSEMATQLTDLKKEIMAKGEGDTTDGLTDEQFKNAVEGASREYYRAENAKMQERVQGLSNGEMWAANALSVITNKASIFDIPQAVKAVLNDIPIDVNAMQMTNLTSSIRDETSRRIGDSALSFLYQTGMSVLDFASAIPLDTISGSSVLTLALMGTTAGVAAAKEATERGMRSQDAVMTAIAAGLIESATEKYSLEALLNPDKAKSIFAYLMKNSFAEGSEEVASELANNLYDRLSNGGLSEYEQNVQRYMADGYSEDAARKAASVDFAKETALAGLGGFLSGLFMAGASSTSVNTRAQISANKAGMSLDLLGDNGRLTFAQNYKTGADQTAYTRGFFQAYNAGQAGDESFDYRDTALTKAQSQAAYYAGQLDASPEMVYNEADERRTLNGGEERAEEGLREAAERGGQENASDSGYSEESAGGRNLGRGDLRNPDVLLSDSSKTALKSRGITHVQVDETTDAETFSKALAEAKKADQRNGWAVSFQSAEDLNGAKLYMTPDGQAGFAIRDGDIEAVFANKSKGAPAHTLASLMPQMIAAGGTKLDCYGPVLAMMYAKYGGFVAVNQIPFNEKYANDGWNEAVNGRPNVITMMLPSTDTNIDNIVARQDTNAVPSVAELNALPVVEDYDKAIAKRNAAMNRARSAYDRSTRNGEQRTSNANRSQRNDRLDSNGQTETMESGSGQTESERQSSSAGSLKARRSAYVAEHAGPVTSSKARGIRGGTESQTFRVVSGNLIKSMPRDMRADLDYVSKQFKKVKGRLGLNSLTFIDGDIEVTENGEVTLAPAFVTENGDMYINISQKDDITRVFTHEEGHKLWKLNNRGGRNYKLFKRFCRENGGLDLLNQTIKAYATAYYGVEGEVGEGTSLYNYILQEVFCDARAGLNPRTNKFGKAAQLLEATFTNGVVNTSAETATAQQTNVSENETRGSPEGEAPDGGTKFYRAVDPDSDEQSNFAPVFYSQLNRIAETMKGEKLGASSIIPFLKGKGVKDEEIKWSGLATFLEGKRSVPKQELLDFLRENELRLEEKTLTEEGSEDRYYLDSDYDRVQSFESLDDAWEAIYQQYWDDHDLENVTVEPSSYWENQWDVIDSETGELLDTITMEKGEGDGPTHWEQYRLGEEEDLDSGNYREYLFTLPSSDYSNRAMGVHWNDQKGVVVHARVEDIEAQHVEHPDADVERDVYESVRNNPPEAFKKFEAAFADNPFFSGYDAYSVADIFENSNVNLDAHPFAKFAKMFGVEMSDAEEAELVEWTKQMQSAKKEYDNARRGKRVKNKILFIDEIQSDWHNAAEEKIDPVAKKKRGYRSDIKDPELVRLQNEADALRQEWLNSSPTSYNFVSRSQDAYARLNEAQHRLQERVLQNALRERGWEIRPTKMEISPGSGVDVDEDGNPSFHEQTETETMDMLEVVDADGKPQTINGARYFWDEDNVFSAMSQDSLLEGIADAVPDAPFRDGKYIEYALKSMLRKAAEGGYDYLSWTTADMQSNRWSDQYAEGYRIEYDQDIPKFLNKYGKQWGVRTEMISLKDGTPQERYSVHDMDEAFQHLVDIGATYESNRGDIAFSQFINDNGREFWSATDRTTGERWEFPASGWMGGSEGVAAPAIRITPEMRDSVLYKGQPKFYRNVDDYFEKGENPVRDIDVNRVNIHGEALGRALRTVLESGSPTDEQAEAVLEEALTTSKFAVELTDNKKDLAIAQERFERIMKSVGDDTAKAIERAKGQWDAFMDSGKFPKASDIAFGAVLADACFKANDMEGATDLTADLEYLTVRSGQVSQAMRIMKKLSNMSPIVLAKTKYKGIIRAIDDINRQIRRSRKYKDGSGDIYLDESLGTRLLRSQNEDEMNVVVDEIYRSLGAQVPRTFREQWNTWRYLAMLGNFRTHVRNIVGNAMFMPSVMLKNKLGAIGEALFIKSGGERTKTLAPIRQEYRDFAKRQIPKYDDKLQGMSTKYLENNKIMEYHKVWGEEGPFRLMGKLFNTLSTLNGKALEKEDQIFLHRHFENAYAGYLQANNIDIATITEEQEARASAYAINEAQKATYRDASAFADALNKFAKSNKAAGLIVESVLPFKKTPINILKRGVEYSPAGLVYQIGKGLYQLHNGDVNVNQWIEGIAEGLSGTLVALLGYMLAKWGILKGKYSDEPAEAEWEKLIGEQAYSVEILGKSYTLDWMAPMSMPLFVGTNLCQEMNDGILDVSEFLEVMKGLPEPMVEMSLLDGFSSLLNAVSYEDTAVGALEAGARQLLTGYLSQLFPTIGGQIARTIDPISRRNIADKTDKVPDDLQYFMQQVMGKLPLASSYREPRINEWGEDDYDASLASRFLENVFLPWYKNEIDVNAVESEIKALYDETGEAGAMPRAVKSTVKIGDRPLSPKEITRYQKQVGQRSYEMLRLLINNPEYEKLNMSDREKVVEFIYTYAVEEAQYEQFNKGFGAKWRQALYDAGWDIETIVQAIMEQRIKTLE